MISGKRDKDGEDIEEKYIDRDRERDYGWGEEWERRE